MKTRLLIIFVCVNLIATGFYLTFEYYQNTIRPLILTGDKLDDIMTSSDSVKINDKLIEVKENVVSVMEMLPENKNPVWLFPTESTNFLRIERDVDRMITSIEKTSTITKDSSAYYTGLLDIRDRASMIRENISDAQGFLYLSVSNIFFTLIWGCGVVGLSIIWIRK